MFKPFPRATCPCGRRALDMLLKVGVLHRERSGEFLDLYVDDGCTWDNDAAQGDAFYDRLAKAFSITATKGDFYLGMDIVQTNVRFITLTSETYICGLCARELSKPISAYTRGWLREKVRARALILASRALYACIL